MAHGRGNWKLIRDGRFGEPQFDTDEWRDSPVVHRYLHGSFEGCDTRFSLYLPPYNRYGGRFYQPLTHIAGDERAAEQNYHAASIEFAVSSGAYLVETNQGSTSPFGDPLDPGVSWKANVAAAEIARSVAAEMYGDHRPFGYIVGTCGGALKAVSAFEAAPGVWDGAALVSTPHPRSLPNHISALMDALPILAPRASEILDSMEPGGTGRLFTNLTVRERDALSTIMRLGFPPQSLFEVEKTINGHYWIWAAVCDIIKEWDESYFTDYWRDPGYLGAEPTVVDNGRVTFESTVDVVVSGPNGDAVAPAVNARDPMKVEREGGGVVSFPVALRLRNRPEIGGDLRGASILIVSGAAEGRRLCIVEDLDGAIITGFGMRNAEGLEGVATGDRAVIDNSDYLAFLAYHHHQVTGFSKSWPNYFVGGEPLYPQREVTLGSHFIRMAGGYNFTGRFSGKMIVVHNLLDGDSFPSNSVHYLEKVREHRGETLDDSFRLWFLDNASHFRPVAQPGGSLPAITTRLVDYDGAARQALLDLVEWVEHGASPPVSTSFSEVDGQVRLPKEASDRKGIQPVVLLTVDGRNDIVACPGDPLRFLAQVEVPPGAGTLVSVEWDFEGRGEFPVGSTLDGSHARLDIAVTHAFEKPGVYFPAMRATATRDGEPGDLLTRVANLGRVRVSVTV